MMDPVGIPNWVWVLVSTHLVSTVITMAGVKAEMKHLMQGLRDVKEDVKTAHKRIDGCGRRWNDN